MVNIDKEFDEEFGKRINNETSFYIKANGQIDEMKTNELPNDIKKFINQKIKEVVESVPVGGKISPEDDWIRFIYGSYINELDIKKWRDNWLKELK